MIARAARIGLLAACAALIGGCDAASAPPGPPSEGEARALADAEEMLAEREAAPTPPEAD
jgi:hypothetical protein